MRMHLVRFGLVATIVTSGLAWAGAMAAIAPLGSIGKAAAVAVRNDVVPVLRKKKRQQANAQNQANDNRLRATRSRPKSNPSLD